MMVGITRRDLQEEFQTLSKTVQLELQMEFVKLNERLENLEGLFVASQSCHQHRQNISEELMSPSLQRNGAAGNDVLLANTDTVQVSKSGTPWLRKLESQEELTDHYFRTFAAGAEAKHWEEVHAIGPVVKSQSSRHHPTASGRKKVTDAWDEMDEGPVQSTMRARVLEIVASPLFNVAIATFVFLNAVTLGVQTDNMARQKLKDVPTAFKAIELIFCCIFALEIILKLIAYRIEYFTNSGWSWNVFDFFVVSMTVVDQVLATVVEFSFSNYSVIRILRILRVTRTIRVIRLLRIIGELRAIVASVLGCIRSLCWTILLLLGIMYIIGMFYTQLLIEERISGNSDLTGCTRYYGSLARSILTLYESVSGGIDWDAAVTPLMSEISPWYGVLYSIYIAFTLLAIMNVVTGVFVESALDHAREDKEIFVVNHVCELKEQMMEEGGGIICWEQFERNLETGEMREIFKHIDVDIKEAASVFKLLDIDENGEIDPEEFLDGILKIGGPASALDLALMMREVRRLTSKVQQIEALCAPSTVPKPKTQPTLRQASVTLPPVSVQNFLDVQPAEKTYAAA